MRLDPSITRRGLICLGPKRLRDAFVGGRDRFSILGRLYTFFFTVGRLTPKTSPLNLANTNGIYV
jgi:hypothetical protein